MSQSAGPWYAVYCRGEVACKLWEEAVAPQTNPQEELRRYVVSHEQVFWFCGGVELVMVDYVVPGN